MSDLNNPSIESMRPEDSSFIPEIQYDEHGNEIPRPFKQKPYEQLSEYGG